VARAKFRDADTQEFTAASKGGVYMPNILEMGGVWTPLSNAWSQVKSNKFAANRFKTAYSTITKMINK
jgi:maltose-binding protein MalE